MHVIDLKNPDANNLFHITGTFFSYLMLPIQFDIHELCKNHFEISLLLAVTKQGSLEVFEVSCVIKQDTAWFQNVS
jgi:hypothetical protein